MLRRIPRYAGYWDLILETIPYRPDRWTAPAASDTSDEKRVISEKGDSKKEEHPEPPAPPPPSPAICCMSGCANCVEMREWEERNQQWEERKKKRERERSPAESVEEPPPPEMDPSMKAFLELERRLKQQQAT